MIRRRHLYHILYPSAWPLLISVGTLFLFSSFAFYMNGVSYSGYFVIVTFMYFLICTCFWLGAIINEATSGGYHSLIVRWCIRNAFQLFIVSEIMVFFGFFWAFFHSSVCPSIFISAHYPPIGINVINPWEFPFFNTMLLIISGFAVTWAHRCISLGDFKQAADACLVTIFLGLFFLCVQVFEYYEASFDITDGIYGSVFYFLTGLHGFHVFAGIIGLICCFVRLCRRHYLRLHYLSFILASWYWHFVDIVWIALFIIVYVWGNL